MRYEIIKIFKSPTITKILKIPKENSSNLNHSFSSSDTFLTPCLQDKYKENLNRNKKEREEGRDCQGKGEDLSANAESRSVLKGENKYVKDLKDLEVINPKPKEIQTQ
jgi:hypothetical protein